MVGYPHICSALRLEDGTRVASMGCGAQLVTISEDKQVLKQIGGKDQSGADSINPNFYSGFQLLENGNYVATNRQNHGPGHGDEGVQILEYDSAGAPGTLQAQHQ